MSVERTIWELGLAELDRVVAELTEAEERRQREKIILIPSESLTPKAVREALGSAFTSIYAEGYPREETLRLGEERLRDFSEQLAYYRRYSDRRFYKGVELADLVEALACRRCAELFATPDVPPEAIYVNIQPLSGAAANLAIYEALLKPGDTLMAMDLTQGGHLSHGSPFHVSGRRYRIVSYGVDPKTEKLDYDHIADVAKREKPKMIVAGYTSYPWSPDWQAFREIASSVGAFLFADVAHTAGLISAGACPTPVGYADVVMFTTHKTICGPRGAVILSFDPDIAARIDQAVFPGAQGGPHVNKFAAMAVAFALAQTPEFKRVMFRIVENAKALARFLAEEGLRVCYGGTNTHLLVVDLRAVPTRNGNPLMGEVAARILDLAGIVANKNTIPGDTSAADARGIRYGTPWVTQRGMGEREMKEIAEITRLVLTEIRPFTYPGVRGPLPRGKIPLPALREAKARVEALLSRFGVQAPKPVAVANPKGKAQVLLVRGGRAEHLLHEASTVHVLRLEPGEATRALFLDEKGEVLSEAVLGRIPDDPLGRKRFLVVAPEENVAALKEWLSALSDGYVLFDPKDILRKVQGPAVVEEFLGQAELRLDGEILEVREGRASVSFLGVAGPAAEVQKAHPELFSLVKPYFVGSTGLRGEGKRARYVPQAQERPLQKTPLHSWHVRAGARLTEFAGYEMPLWYTSALAEHRAVRTAAGLFDLGHMGVFSVSGRYAESFLNLVTTNYAGWLLPGQSQYGYLLDPEGRVIDDLMVYRLSAEEFVLIVNAANEEKDWDWLCAVNEGRTLLDGERPWIEPDGPVTLCNLKKEEGVVDLALQGPASRAVLSRLLSPRDRHRLVALRRTEFLELRLAGQEVLCARTGYTGEPLGYELLVPGPAVETVWEALLAAGRDKGVVPCGLAARDSLRTEAGLPLYGHELAGELEILPHEAGFAPYVKVHKPFFVGREAYLRALQNWTREVVRFGVEPGQRPIRAGAPVVDSTGTVVGKVTSCVVLEDGQVGMALVPRSLARENTRLGFVVSPGSENRVPLVIWGKVLPRFLRKDVLPTPGGE